MIIVSDWPAVTVGSPTMIVWVTLGVVEIVGVGEGTGVPEAVGDKDAVRDGDAVGVGQHALGRSNHGHSSFPGTF